MPSSIEEILGRITGYPFEEDYKQAEALREIRGAVEARERARLVPSENSDSSVIYRHGGDDPSRCRNQAIAEIASETVRNFPPEMIKRVANGEDPRVVLADYEASKAEK